MRQKCSSQTEKEKCAKQHVQTDTEPADYTDEERLCASGGPGRTGVSYCMRIT